MIRILGKVTNYLVLIYTFLTNKENVKIVRSVFNIAEEVAKHTKNDLDNAALASIATYVRHETKGLSKSEMEKVSEAVNNKSTGDLRTVSLGINLKDGVTLETKFGSVHYNYKNGSVKWGRELRF